jgi:chemotaxis protein CheX
MMDVKYINPFIDSTVNTMETMLGVSPERENLFLKRKDARIGDISGVIKFKADDVFGAVALTFPAKTALWVCELMINQTFKSLTEEVRDTVVELVRIVAGGAKDGFAALGISYNISTCSIVIAKSPSAHRRDDSPVLVIPFKLRDQRFFLEVCIDMKSVDSAFQSEPEESIAESDENEPDEEPEAAATAEDTG